MFKHAPDKYKCPICLGVKGVENKSTLLKPEDLVYQDDLVSAFINSFFIGKSPGHVIVVPNKHFENIYELPSDYATRIFEVAQKIAIAIKRAYGCDGITTLQNNEPAGGQHAFHYHFHIFPRYENDDLHKYMGEKKLASPEKRSSYAQKIKAQLTSIKARKKA